MASHLAMINVGSLAERYRIRTAPMLNLVECVSERATTFSHHLECETPASTDPVKSKHAHGCTHGSLGPVGLGNSGVG